MTYATLWYGKSCITHKLNIKIDWNFGNKLILYISTELCPKISMLGSNGPLNQCMLYHLIAKAASRRSKVRCSACLEFLFEPLWHLLTCCNRCNSPELDWLLPSVFCNPLVTFKSKIKITILKTTYFFACFTLLKAYRNIGQCSSL